jgi:hypothetical protein
MSRLVWQSLPFYDAGDTVPAALPANPSPNLKNKTSKTNTKTHNFFFFVSGKKENNLPHLRSTVELCRSAHKYAIPDTPVFC